MESCRSLLALNSPLLENDCNASKQVQKASETTFILGPSPQANWVCDIMFVVQIDALKSYEMITLKYSKTINAYNLRLRRNAAKVIILHDFSVLCSWFFVAVVTVGVDGAERGSWRWWWDGPRVGSRLFQRLDDMMNMWTD